MEDDPRRYGSYPITESAPKHRGPRREAGPRGRGLAEPFPCEQLVATAAARQRLERLVRPSGSVVRGRPFLASHRTPESADRLEHGNCDFSAADNWRSPTPDMRTVAGARPALGRPPAAGRCRWSSAVRTTTTSPRTPFPQVANGIGRENNGPWRETSVSALSGGGVVQPSRRRATQCLPGRHRLDGRPERASHSSDEGDDGEHLRRRRRRGGNQRPMRGKVGTGMPAPCTAANPSPSWTRHPGGSPDTMYR